MQKPRCPEQVSFHESTYPYRADRNQYEAKLADRQGLFQRCSPKVSSVVRTGVLAQEKLTVFQIALSVVSRRYGRLFLLPKSDLAEQMGAIGDNGDVCCQAQDDDGEQSGPSSERHLGHPVVKTTIFKYDSHTLHH